MAQTLFSETVQIPRGRLSINGDLHIPKSAAGLVLFAHGSGSGRFSRRNRAVAKTLENAGFATLLLDLLTADEELEDQQTAEHRFNIPLLGDRVLGAIDWLATRDEVARLPVAIFGASTGAAAAMIAAATRPASIHALVSRGGRPDLAGDALRHVAAPTLLIVGGDDAPVIALNEEAMRRMQTTVELAIVPGATHLFEEPGALEEVGRLAVAWCRRYLVETSIPRPTG
jgi:putative phosphoribosyl transferase